PPALDALIAQMMDKDPGLRPRDGAEVRAALASLSTGAASWSSRRLPPSSGLRGGERRLVSVVLVGRSSQAAVADTLTEDDVIIGLNELRKVAEARGGQAVLLADGSIAVTHQGGQVATDQAAQAARSALAIRALAPDRPVSLATGRSELSGRLRRGAAIDRGARMLARPGAAAGALPVVIDEVTAGLLGPRFAVEESERGLLLLGEDDRGIPLLGKRTACVGRERELARLQD